MGGMWELGAKCACACRMTCRRHGCPRAAGMIVLFDDKYQPAPRGGGDKPPQFAAEQNYGQYIYFYRNGVSSPTDFSLCCCVL